MKFLIHENYICELINNTQYKISGLKHSGIKEQETYCGDGIVNGGETCSSCPVDVGVCPSNGGGSSGGGGGGGGGGSSGGFIPPRMPTYNTTEPSANKTELGLFTNESQDESTSGKGGATITGGVIGALNKNKGFLAIGFVVVVIMLFVVFNEKARTKFNSIKKAVKKKRKGKNKRL